MGFIGDAIGRVMGRNQEVANAQHAKNAEQREQTEKAKESALDKAGQAIGRINSQEDPNASVFGEMASDIAEAGGAIVDAAGATIEDAFSDAKAALDDAATELEKGAKNAAGTVGVIGKAVGGFFKGIFNSGVEGAKKAVDE